MIITKNRQVSFTELTSQLAYILYKLEIFHSTNMSPQPSILVITSMNDSSHMPNSRHYKNQALDLRSKNFHSAEEKLMFRKRLEDWLGPQYIVLLENQDSENEHFHIQVK